jgi:hypothetical protein
MSNETIRGQTPRTKNLYYKNFYLVIWLLYILLPPFQNIRCFSFVKQMHLDIF